MDYEKKYKEALERAKLILSGEGVPALPGMNTIEAIFPELAKSKDEKIRKVISDVIHLDNNEIRSILDLHNISYQDAWDWLEKQCEEKHLAIPKFRVGDTIRCKYDDRVFTIKSVDTKQGVYYYTQEKCGNDIDYADEMFELVEQKTVEHNYDTTIDNELNDYCCKVYNALHKENGGNLSFARLQHLAMDIYKWCKDQKPEWSEKEKKKLDRIYSILGIAADEHAFSTTCRLIGDKEAIELQDFLRSVAKPQPQSEWSEEDIETRKDIIDRLERLRMVTTGSEKELCKEIFWLKSLRPQHHWKASEEQVEALIYAIKLSEGEGEKGRYYLQFLHSLMSDLNKLDLEAL